MSVKKLITDKLSIKNAIQENHTEKMYEKDLNLLALEGQLSRTSSRWNIKRTRYPSIFGRKL